MNTKIMLILMFLLGFLTVEAQDLLTQDKYQLPLLIGKERNPVLRLTINLNASKKLNEVTVTVPAYAEDIDQIQLFNLKSDSSQITDSKLLATVPFGKVKKISSRTYQIAGDLELNTGINYLWLTVKLKPNANYNHVLNITLSSVKLDHKVQTVSAPRLINQHVAVALRQHNQENVHTHRIPGITTANDGTLLAVYDARRTKGGDLQGDIDIGLSRSVDKGKTWLPMQVVLDMGEWGGLPQKFNGVSDPCILVDKTTGDIFVAGLWMHGVLDKDGKWIEGLNEQSKDWNHQWRDKGSQLGFDVKQSAQFMITKSSDNGKTWSKPLNITKMCKKEEWWLWAPAPGAGITLKDGTLVFPTQGRNAKGKAFSNITYSKDHGATWHTSNAATTESTTENMVVELSDGSIMLNARSGANRTDTSSKNGRVVAVTKDLGVNWVIHPTSHQALPEPTCMASIIKHNYLQNGIKKTMLVFCNPDSKVARNNITVKVSFDDGKTWKKRVLLDEWKGRGYSCLTSVDAETIGVLYESSQADLVFQTLKLNELL